MQRIFLPAAVGVAMLVYSLGANATFINSVATSAGGFGFESPKGV